MPSLLPETAYRGRVWETGAGARTAPAAALRAAVSRSFQTTPCRLLVRPAVDVIASPLVICGKVKELSPRVWEATLPCDVPELSGDLPVIFTVRIFAGPLAIRSRVAAQECLDRAMPSTAAQSSHPQRLRSLGQRLDFS